LHSGYERLVFEAPQAAALPVDVAEKQVTIGPKLEVHPDGLARIRRLRSVETAAAEAGVLVIGLKSEARTRILRLQPDRLVLDFTTNAGRSAPSRAETPSAERSEERPATATAPAKGPVAESKPHATIDSRAAQTAAPTPTASARQPDAKGIAPNQRSQPMPQAPGPKAQEQTPGNRLLLATPGQAPPASEAMEVSIQAEARLRGHVGVSAVEPPASPPALLFDWPAVVGAAAYARSGRVWIVFDHVPDAFLLDRPGLARLAPHGLRRIRTYTRDDAALVELLLDGVQAITMEPAGDRWRAVIGPSPAPPHPLLSVEGGTLRLEGVRRLLRVADPVVGDTITVATATTALPAAPDGRRFVDLAILPSFQGLAWIARSDDLGPSLEQDTLRISRAGGLRLSQAVRASAEADATQPIRAQDARLKEKPERLDTGAGSLAAAGAGQEAEPQEDLVARAAAVRTRATGQEAEQRAATAEPADNLAAASDPDEVAAAAVRQHDPEPPALPAEPAPPAQVAQSATVAGLPRWQTRSGLAELATLDLVSRRHLEQQVKAALADVKDREAVPLALELARLRLAEAFAPESLVALQLAPDTAPVDTRIAERRALLAAAALALGGERDAAARLLQGPEFAEDPEADAWLGWLAAQNGDWETAALRLERQARLFESYPQPLRLRFMLAALAAALQTGNPDRAYVWLERLSAENPGPPLADRARFLEAMTLARDGAHEAARQLLAQLAQSASWEIAAESVYAGVDLARAFGQLAPEDELATLLRERALWRGHPLEPRVLRRIGGLQSETGDVLGALASWREALDRYPDDATLAGLQDEMRALLVAALDPATPPNPSPLTMLRIFREFPELRPPPPAARLLVRHLAQSLAAIGLAGPALALVRGEGDLDEPEDVLFEAGLALAAGDADEALRLIESRFDREASDRIRLLRAQALLQLGRAQEALSALAGLSGPAPERVRADAAWQAGRIDLLATLADPLMAAAAETGDLFDRLRAARALAALAQIKPQQARALMESAAANWDASLLAAVRLWLPELPLPADPRDVATAARAWVAAAKGELAALEGPLRAASLPVAATVR
jgi:hypothetical protein